ncbi:MAG: hypothetical protein J7M34_11620, partial [Anaerolineae bacterium]|nr:hypothetical protein [Anaerolineae bacterium]
MYCIKMIGGCTWNRRNWLRPAPFAGTKIVLITAPLVYPLATPAGGLALIVYGDSVRALELDFTDNDPAALLVKREGENATGGY